ncbi:tRNA-dihydrouridine(16/17) synthase [NAD(P)(+)]-like isoform X2 [Ostrea edulis]|uniref:tRNA-dihydrouridine(16/17) synthase [NAD(P)(+)]-like isoform X2 n=1 Tax=Ostrea edulis TaxID=37623 RepID=UPI0020949985|nr:tRNA-dihydrouridine(16/17) synthase [NAD(P)(+)]-like isoform X2 [Ostrea edulis]
MWKMEERQQVEETVQDKRKLSGFDFWRRTLSSAKYVVAPMVDASELAWRMLSRKYGAQLCYTPMFHASVFVRDPNYRKEAMQTCPEDRPLIVQFCANDPDTFLRAGRYVEDVCDAVDLNLGCPQTIAKRGHYGAFLEDEWDLLKKMVELCHQKLKVPVTCKIRMFESKEKTVLYAQMLEKAGCQLLTVHGRTKEQKGRFTGLADWDVIKLVRESVSIPVFANGNIQYLPDVDRCIHQTGVQGVMSAEGNLHNPALFSGDCPPVWKMAEDYLELAEKYPCPLSYSRGHVFKIFHHSLNVHPDIRDIIASGKSLECFRLATLKLKERCLADAEKHKTNPELFSTELPFPYWICQPYVRPDPNDKEKNKDKRTVKRPLEEKLQSPEFAGMSKNKVKKLLRNPLKKLARSSEENYEKCVACANIRGRKCSYMMCKNCCKVKTFRETLDCKGHRIVLHTKNSSKAAFDQKKKEMEEKTAVHEIRMIDKCVRVKASTQGNKEEREEDRLADMDLETENSMELDSGDVQSETRDFTNLSNDNLTVTADPSFKDG